MKKKILIPLLIITGLLPASCEDVVQVDLDTAAPKLVVEASINWQKGSGGQGQVIRLSTTAAFYSDTIPPVAGANVFVSNSSGEDFHFIGFKDFPGSYACNNFEPVLGETYTLTIIYKGETYTAAETMLPVPDLLNVTQENGGFTEDVVTIKAYFNDPPNETNYYMHRFIRNEKRAQSGVINDRFVNGNLTYAVRLFDNLPKGEALRIELYGISRRYYEYMDKVLTTISEGNTGPFKVPPAQIRGNIINQSNPDNYALGYFRLSEVTSIPYAVQ